MVRRRNPPIHFAEVFGPRPKDVVIPPDEQLSLLAMARAGDREAGDRLARSYLPLVFNLAIKYQGRGLDLADLLSAGSEGLARAMVRHEDGRGSGFSTTAWSGIVGAIKHDLARARSKPLVTLDQDEDFGSPFDAIPDRVPDPDAVDDADREVGMRALSKLRRSDREVIAEYHGLDGHGPKNFREIAQDLGISYQAVQCRYIKAMGRARDLVVGRTARAEPMGAVA